MMTVISYTFTSLPRDSAKCSMNRSREFADLSSIEEEPRVLVHVRDPLELEGKFSRSMLMLRILALVV